VDFRAAGDFVAAVCLRHAAVRAALLWTAVLESASLSFRWIYPFTLSIAVLAGLGRLTWRGELSPTPSPYQGEGWGEGESYLTRQRPPQFPP